VILDVPRYDFGWQTNYRLAEPKFMPRGTRMDCYPGFPRWTSRETFPTQFGQ